MKSDVTQGVYIVKTGSYSLPNQAEREEERTGERDHHPAPEGCQNMRTTHPDRVAVAGEADNEPSENKKDCANLLVRLFTVNFKMHLKSALHCPNCQGSGY